MIEKKEKKKRKEKTLIIYTSMRKVGELRTLQIGSPWRSVKRESFPLGPTSHILSTASTPSLSLFGSNSLTLTSTVGANSNSPITTIMISKSMYENRREWREGIA